MRREESNAWRYPVDLIALLTNAFAELPGLTAAGSGEARKTGSEDALIQTVLGDDPQATVDALLTALRSGWSAVELARTVTRAAALRIARFHNIYGESAGRGSITLIIEGICIQCVEC